MTKEVGDFDFQKKVLESQTLVLVDFWAEWCGPCRQLGPILDEVTKDMKGIVEIYKMNIDQNPEVPTRYGVRSIPTMMIFKSGQLLSTKVGALPKSTIVDWVKEFV